MHITCNVMMCDQQDGGESMHCACPKYVYDHDMRIMHNMCMCMIAAGLNVKTCTQCHSLMRSPCLPFQQRASTIHLFYKNFFPGKCEKGNVMLQVHRRRQGSLVAKMCSQNSCFRLKSFPPYSFLGETHL